MGIGLLGVFFLRWGQAPWWMGGAFFFFLALLFLFVPHLISLSSNQLMRKIYEEAPYGVLFLGADQTFLGANPKLRDFFSFSPNSPLSLESFMPFLNSPESMYAFERLKAYTLHHQKGRENLEIKLPSGFFDMMVHVKPLHLSYVLWFFEIRPSNPEESLDTPFFSEFLENLPSPLLVVSALGKIRHANQAFCEWLGYSPEDLIQKHLGRFLEEKVVLTPTQSARLISFVSLDGYKKRGVIQQIYPLKTPNEDFCLFIRPEIVKAEEMTHFAGMLESIPLPALFLDHRGMIRMTNRAFEKVVRERKILGRHLKDWLGEEERSQFDRFLQQVRRDKDGNNFLVVQLKEKTPAVWMRLYGTHLSSLGWDPIGCFLILCYDITEIQKRENQTLESQKLQALGQLAGGISHDFNNLLTAMLGFCDLLLQKHTPQDNSFTDIMQIKQNANRAANLVRQLLLFAKQSAPKPKPLDLRESLNEMSFLLRRLIGPKINLQIKHDRGVRTIHADQGQFEQIIMNLAINARDAMPNGGELIFRTKLVHLKENLPLIHHILTPRPYIVVDVEDTGSGIPLENLQKIFTPFFSTKTPGRGTGIGLATVYQILESMGGGIHVESELGVGTTFSVFLPRHVDRKKREEDIIPEESRGHLADFWESARILIVEDEDPVRLFAFRALKSKGYEVWEAKDGSRGFEILQKNPNITLLITDVMMPGMDGPTLANAAYGLNPQLKVLFVSGYPEEEIQMKLSFPKEQVYFLPKPFNLNELAVKVHDVLDHQ